MEWSKHQLFTKTPDTRHRLCCSVSFFRGVADNIYRRICEDDRVVQPVMNEAHRKDIGPRPLFTDLGQNPHHSSSLSRRRPLAWILRCSRVLKSVDFSSPPLAHIVPLHCYFWQLCPLFNGLRVYENLCKKRP